MFVNHRHRFKVLDKAFRIIVKDHTGIQQVLGVKDGLDFFHHFVSLIAPFMTNERSHVPPCSMLGFERAVVLVDYESVYIEHEATIHLHILRAIEPLGNNKVDITIQGMAINTRIIVAVTAQQFIQFCAGLRHIFKMEGHVFDENRGAQRTSTAHRREDARPDGPIAFHLLRIVGKMNRIGKFERAERLRNGRDIALKFFGSICFGLGKHRRQLFPYRHFNRRQ